MINFIFRWLYGGAIKDPKFAFATAILPGPGIALPFDRSGYSLATVPQGAMLYTDNKCASLQANGSGAMVFIVQGASVAVVDPTGQILAPNVNTQTVRVATGSSLMTATNAQSTLG